MRPPEFWNHRHGRDSAPMIRTLLKPLSWLYAHFAARRIRRAEPLNIGIPVICVGNATLGGTGKTPVCAYLIQSLRRLGIDAHGLTRGYGGQEKGPLAVGRHHNADDIGDEPLLLARHGPIWVSAKRDDGARAARAFGASALIMDDGHQNPQLEKTLSLLVVDAEIGFGNGCVFPAGPLRESLKAALSRADAIILMKPEPNYEIDDNLRSQLKDHLIITAYLAPKSAPPKGRLYAFAGIGRPNKFFDSLRRNGGNIVEEIPFSDHHKYKDFEIESLFKMASEDAAHLITTEKDYVRLPQGYRKGIKAWPVHAVFEDELSLRRLLHPIIERAKIFQQ